MVFHKATIAKVFPGYAAEPFPGKVHKVDTGGSDDKPFKIHYDDGDKEWVTLTELSEILVDPDLQERARLFLTSGVLAEEGPAPPAQPAPASGRKRTSQETGQAQAGSKKPKSAPAAAAAAAAGDGNPSRKAGRSSQQPAAGTSGGAGKPSKAAGRASAAAAAAGASVQVSDGVTPDELDGLVKDVCQGASKHARELQQESIVMRLPYKGPAATTLPLMSQGVTFGHGALFTVYGTSSGSSQIDYRAETEDALRRLDHLLDTTGGVNKKLLTQVRVYLRNMEEGLPGFTQAWNSWVDHKSPPVLTILQGSGPVSTAGVVLEVSACTGR